MPIERSTFVLISSVILILLFWLWQPITISLWHIDNTFFSSVLWILYGLGWGLVFLSTYFINHFDLFGIRQVYLYWRKQEYTHTPFATPGLYQYVRHPLYFGFLIALWATPSMTLGHLVLAIGMTAYLFIGMHYEEKDLCQYFGESYQQYRQRVAKIIPWLPKK